MPGDVCLYNEWDGRTAHWLGELIEHGSLPQGTVDTRSITDLAAEDVSSYRQAHFFAGIGGWPLALRWAGLEGMPGVWTGSPPCQPFSIAGLKKGKNDDRHLAPVWLGLIKQCKPALIFGEQVEAAIRHGWLDDLFDELEGEGYTCGAAVLPACSAGAPHIRKRVFFGAIRLANPYRPGCGEQWRPIADEAKHAAPERKSEDGRAWSIIERQLYSDGKTRPFEPGAYPVADGVPGCVGLLRGYGNAIVPQVGAGFIRAFMDAVKSMGE